MNDFQSYFKDKKVTVMGLGILGRGVGDAAYIAEAGAQEVLVTDLKTEAELKTSVDQLSKYENVKFVLGEHREEDFKGRDLILVAPSVPLQSPYKDAALAEGTPLKQSAALFAEIAGIPVIGVTGTRGKSTVTNMIHHVLSTVTGESIILGGNVRGVSNLQLLHDVHENSLAVMELDSWQLQGWGWAKMSPQIAVFTNFTIDHIDYYQKGGKTPAEALELYFADKANIFINQEDSGVLVTTPEVFTRAEEFAAGKNITLGQEVVLVDDSMLPNDLELVMPGAHNRINASLAYAALKATSLDDEAIFEALVQFPGLEGRLQLATAHRGSKVYNDNNSSSPTAVARALEAVADGKNVVLLTGGTDKESDLMDLPDVIKDTCEHLILYSGTGTDKLKVALPESIQYEEHSVFKDAVQALGERANGNNVLLFSPGFSSKNDEFNNAYERNDLFLDLISEYE